jgi:hypothetical protein
MRFSDILICALHACTGAALMSMLLLVAALAVLAIMTQHPDLYDFGRAGPIIAYAWKTVTAAAGVALGVLALAKVTDCFGEVTAHYAELWEWAGMVEPEPQFVCQAWCDKCQKSGCDCWWKGFMKTFNGKYEKKHDACECGEACEAGEQDKKTNA